MEALTLFGISDRSGLTDPRALQSCRVSDNDYLGGVTSASKPLPSL